MRWRVGLRSRLHRRGVHQLFFRLLPATQSAPWDVRVAPIPQPSTSAVQRGYGPAVYWRVLNISAVGRTSCLSCRCCNSHSLPSLGRREPATWVGPSCFAFPHKEDSVTRARPCPLAAAWTPYYRRERPGAVRRHGPRSTAHRGRAFSCSAFARYWRSFSAVENIEKRGYQMLQLFPGNQLVAGVPVDLDVVQSDYLGSRPVWAFASPKGRIST
jgi:hypothetical protein